MPVAVGSPQPYSPTSRRGAALEPTKLSWLLGLVSLEKPQVPRTRSSPSSDSSELQIQIPRFASLETTHWMDEKEFTSVELQLRELHRAQEVEEAHGFSRSVLAKAISRERNVSQQSHFSNDLFISHCWRGGGKSQEIKRRIIAELSKDEGERPGSTYWADYLDLHAQGPVEWRKEIEDGIVYSAKCIAFIDQHYLCSFNCLQELAYAFEHGKPVVPIILTQQAWELLTTPGGADRVWSMALQDVTGNDLSPLCSSEGTCLTSSQTFDFEVLQSLFHKLSSINFCPCRELDFSARSAEVVLSTAAAFVRENIAYFKEHNELNRRSLQWAAKGRPMSPAVLLYGGDVMSWREWCRQALSLEQEPNPTPLMIEFVEASERRQKIRRGFVVATTTAVMLAVIALTTWAMVMRAIADQQRQEAELQRLEAERHAARSTMMLLLGSALNRGRLSPADLRAVALATNIATAINDTQSVEPQLLGLLRGLQEEKVWMLEELRPQGLADQMTALAWSPSSSDPLLAGGFDDGTLAVWPDALGGGTNAPLVLRGGHTNRVTSVAWGGDSRAIALPLLASAARDGRLLVWEPTGGGGYLPRPLGSDEQRHGDVMSVAWSPIRASVPPLLAASARDGNVTIWLWQGEPPPSVPLWTLPRRLDGDNSTPTKPAGAVAFSPDGSLLVCGFDSGSILVWELPEALGDTLPIHRLVGSHNYRVTSLAFRPGPRNGPFVLASASAGGFPFNRTAVPEVRLWSVAGSGTPELLTVIPTAFQRPVASLAWLSPSLKSLAVSSDSGDVDILRLTGSDDTWGLEERFALPSPPGSSSSPSSVAVSAAGVLASSHGSAATDSCRAGRARLWATGGIMSRVAYTLAPRVGEHSAGSPEGCCLAWGHGGQYLAAATAIGQGDNWQWTISIFEPYAAEDSASSIIRPSIVLPATGRLNSLAWQQGGRGLIAGGSDGMVLLWEGKDSLLTAEQGGGPQWRVEVGEGYVNALAWSPGDNARLAVGSQSGEVSVWAGSPGGLQRLSVPATHRHSGWIRTVAWSSDGVMLASGGQDGHVLVLDTGSASSLNLTVPTRPTAPGSLGVFVRELSWTSGGVLVIGMDDGSISKWDPHSAVGAAATQVPVRSSCTSLTALDASGREGRLLTGWADGSFQVIDLDRAEGLVGAWNLSPVSGQQVDDVAGSPDGRFVSFLREDGTAGLLVTGFEALREQLMGMVVGELNEQDVLDLGLPRGIELSAARAEAVLQDRAP